MESGMPKTLLPFDHDKEDMHIYEILYRIKLNLTIDIRATSLSDHPDLKNFFDLDLLKLQSFSLFNSIKNYFCVSNNRIKL